LKKQQGWSHSDVSFVSYPLINKSAACALGVLAQTANLLICTAGSIL